MVRSVTNINIKNTVQSQKKKQNNRNNLQFIVTKDIKEIRRTGRKECFNTMLIVWSLGHPNSSKN